MAFRFTTPFEASKLALGKVMPPGELPDRLAGGRRCKIQHPEIGNVRQGSSNGQQRISASANSPIHASRSDERRNVLRRFSVKRDASAFKFATAVNSKVTSKLTVHSKLGARRFSAD